jgi:hypothetical protein
VVERIKNMKTEQDIRKEIEVYKEIIREYYTPDDYDLRDRFKARINALEWVLDIE